MVLNRVVAWRAVYYRVGGSRIRLERREHAESLATEVVNVWGPLIFQKLNTPIRVRIYHYERLSVSAACATFVVFENGRAPCALSDGWKMLWKIARSGACISVQSILGLLGGREPSKGVTLG